MKKKFMRTARIRVHRPDRRRPAHGVCDHQAPHDPPRRAQAAIEEKRKAKAGAKKK